MRSYFVFPIFIPVKIAVEVICLVDEIEISENKEALIVLAGTVAGAATTFVASLPIPLELKAPMVALATTVTGAILLYWKSKVNKQ
jgi:hypothetical protein